MGIGYGSSAIFLEMNRDRGARDFHVNMDEIKDAEHFIMRQIIIVENIYHLITFEFHLTILPFGYYERISE